MWVIEHAWFVKLRCWKISFGAEGDFGLNRHRTIRPLEAPNEAIINFMYHPLFLSKQGTDETLQDRLPPPW